MYYRRPDDDNATGPRICRMRSTYRIQTRCRANGSKEGLEVLFESYASRCSWGEPNLIAGGTPHDSSMADRGVHRAMYASTLSFRRVFALDM